MQIQNLGSLPKSGISTRLVLNDFVLQTQAEVFMSDIVKICSKHGELTKNDVTTNDRCLECAREYARDYRKKYPEKIKNANEKYKTLVKEYKSHGYEYKPSRKNNRYIPGRTSIDCKKHGLVEGHQLIVRENDYIRCRLCAYERNRSWEKRNPDKVKKIKRNNYLRNCSRYAEESIARQKKISVSHYKELLEKSNGLCGICGQPETRITRKDQSISPLSIDHCHRTGKIRDLLCNKCNRGLGLFDDDEEKLIKASNYITKWKKEFSDDNKG